MKPIIKINLSPRDYAGHINLGNRVGASLTGNSSFPTPAVTLVNLAAVVNALALWAPIGGRGSHADLLDLRDKTLTLRNLLIAEANYVQTTAQISAGNNYSAMAAIIGTSGFEIRNPKSPQGVLQMVQGLHRFVSRQLAPNQVKLKWKKPLNVTSHTNVKEYSISTVQNLS